MEVRLLRAFVTLAGHRTFGATAEVLSITQPALTKQIQALEAQVGGPLFHRGRQGAEPTELGRALLPDAQEIVDRADALRLRARRITEGGTSHLSIGFGMSSIDLAPRDVAEFRRRHPGIGVTLDDMSSSVQVDRVRRGELDAGYVRLPTGDGLEVLELGGDTLALASPPDPTRRPPIAPADIGAAMEEYGLVQLSRAKGPGLADQVDAYLAACASRPEVIQHANDLQTVLALVAAGVGAALVPERVRGIAPAQVSITPIDHPAARWRVGVVWDPDRPPRALTTFLDVVRSLPRT
ncbi:LysR substrate-binding domain-containing protein [Kitasatospora sp. NPDC059327]|uniref:LysR substrate-binding domain-containing protein n=1 Tax=Kitasatospora sp. NPDC059327 TaxID=3346803 RepID=UPI003684D8FC